MSFFIFLWLANNEKGSSKAGKHVELERVNVNKGDTKRAKRGSLELVEAGQTARKKQTQRLVFPCEAQLRPDRILYFIINKLLVPVPWESRIDEAYERKNLNTANYDNWRDKGWFVWCYPVEALCRGFVRTSTIRSLQQVRQTAKEINNAINQMSVVVERASSWLWLRRSESRWIKVAHMSCNPTGTADRDCMIIKVQEQSKTSASSLKTKHLQQRYHVLY